MKKPKSYCIGTRITEELKAALEKHLIENAHINQADYLRDLVRRDLERRGYIQSPKLKKI